MKNFNAVIDQYNFHDSIITKINFDPCADGLLRNLILEIDYYNWEGNYNANAEWTWKKMLFEIEHCFLLRYEFPNIIENGQEISHVELYDSDIQMIESYYDRNKKNIYYNVLKDKTFENCLSVNFFTHGSDSFEPIFGEPIGFLKLAGFNGRIETTISNERQGAIHIPVKK
jgi:hypothetical protein